MTTRGYKEKEFITIAHYIDDAINHKDDLKYLSSLKEQVIELNRHFPLPY